MTDLSKYQLTRRNALAAGSSLAAAIGTLGFSGSVLSAEKGKEAVEGIENEEVMLAGPQVKPAINPKGAKIAPYKAACVRTKALGAYDSAGVFIPENLAANVESVARAAERGADEIGAKLYSFSEFCLQPAPYGAPLEETIKASIAADGPEIERLAQAAQKANAFLALSVNERIPQFPGRYFVSGMIIAPNGNLILNYRKLGSLSNKTRPADILPQWLDIFGEDSLFPVADTEIGRLAFAIALDTTQPEILRGSVLKGAEIILNPTASITAQVGPVPSLSTMVRRVRAYENMVYLMLSNLGPVPGDHKVPTTRQPSEIIDYRGNLLNASQDDSEGFTTATLKIDELRQARTGLGFQNFLAALQMDVHKLTYNAADFAPSDAFLDKFIKTNADHDDVIRETVKALVSRGVLIPPGAG